MMAPRCVCLRYGNSPGGYRRDERRRSAGMAIAYKEIDAIPEKPTSEELENGLTLMGPWVRSTLPGLKRKWRLLLVAKQASSR